MTREEVQGQLEKAMALANDPSTVFCVEPFDSVQDESGPRLSNLLAKVASDPARSLMVVTGEAFVFGFATRDFGTLGENAPEAEPAEVAVASR